MTDKYTVYPEALRKRIQRVDNFMVENAKEKERWAALSDEEKEAEIKEAERFNGLTPEQQEAEIQAQKEKDKGQDPNQPKPGEETIESLKADLEKTRQALNTLKGKYDKEPAEMQREINFLKDQITLLQKSLEKPEVKKEPEPPKKIVLSEELKEEIADLEKEMDPEIVKRVMKINERIFELAKKEARQEISEVAVQFDSKLALSAKERFDKDLIEAYPDWETMWKTPEFQAFIREEDGLSGEMKYTAIKRGFERLNSRVVLKAFDLFTGKKRVEPTNGDKDKVTADQDKLKNRLSPGKSSSPGAPAQPKKPTDKMTPKEAREALVALSANYTRGKYVGSKEEYDKEYAKLAALAKETTQ